jgi:hypothetical protein
MTSPDARTAAEDLVLVGSELKLVTRDARMTVR